MVDSEIVVNRPSTIRTRFYLADGSTDTSTSPAATWSAVDLAGTTVASGTATFASPNWTATVTPTDIDVWTVTWTKGTQTKTTIYPVVGRHIVEPDDIRSGDARVSSFSQLDLRDHLTRASSFAETWCGVAFRPRKDREVIRGRGSSWVPLRWGAVRGVDRVLVDGTQIADFEVHVSGFLRLPFATTGTVEVTYRHGYDAPPLDLARAVLLLTAAWAVRDITPSRAVAEVTDVGVFRLSTPGRDGPTGLPEVDAVLARYRWPRVVG